MTSKPSEDEKHSYYYGLHGRPLLIARSSINEWSPIFEDEHQTQKVVYPVGEHAIVEIWAVELIPQLCESLSDSDFAWQSLDLVRIGYVGTPYKDCSVVVWISMEPGSTSWQTGQTCVRKCLEILQAYSLYDVHCEVREGRLIDQAGPVLLPPNVDPKLSVFSATVGNSISAVGHPKREGTLSLILEDRKTLDRYGLTCRHVLFTDDDTTAYDWEVGCTKIEVIQPGSTSWSEQHAEIVGAIEAYDSVKAPTMEHKMCRGRAISRARIVKSFREEEDRVIGFVTFAPALALYESIWLRDFAIINLDKAKFGEYTGNAVRIDDITAQDKMLESTDTKFQGFVHKLNLMGEKSPRILKLQHLVALDEILALRGERRSDVVCKVVGKRGRGSGLTFGCLNNVQSVARRKGVISEELCITSAAHARFSQKGDSGAAVFDSEGNVYGMLTSGLNGQVDSADITYVTPIMRILDSIKEERQQDLRLLTEV